MRNQKILDNLCKKYSYRNLVSLIDKNVNYSYLDEFPDSYYYEYLSDNAGYCRKYLNKFYKLMKLKPFCDYKFIIASAELLSENNNVNSEILCRKGQIIYKIYFAHKTSSNLHILCTEERSNDDEFDMIYRLFSKMIFKIKELEIENYFVKRNENYINKLANILNDYLDYEEFDNKDEREEWMIEDYEKYYA